MNAIISNQTPLGVFAIRDAIAEDAICYRNYWINSSDHYLKSLGVDRHRLGSAESIQARFLTMLRNGDDEQAKIIYSITLNDHLIGYANLNRYEDLSYGYGHVHSYFAELKKALRLSTNKANKPNAACHTNIGSILIGQVISSMFETTPVQKVIAQTRISNIKVNKALDYYLASNEGEFVAQPDGLSNPGHFFTRHFLRDKQNTLKAQLNLLCSDT